MIDGYYIAYVRNKATKHEAPLGFFTTQDEAMMCVNMNRMKVGKDYETFYIVTDPNEFDFFRRVAHGEFGLQPSV